MITCGWCGTHYTSWRSKCDSCGGPMPPKPGHELGTPPPAVPRPLPAGYEMRTRFFNIGVLLGLAFTLLPGFIIAALIAQGKWLPALFPLLFLLGGFSLFRYAWGKASGIIRALRHGTAVAGKVAALNLDMHQSMNGRHPWRLVYHFTVDGHNLEGVVTTFDTTLADRRSGQPVWVLYNEKDPNQNTLYPPMKYF